MKEIHVAFINSRIKEGFESLKEGKFEDKRLYDFINRALDDLKKDPTCGIRIPKQNWPKDYVKNFDINNLWKYDLPNAWRLIYTIESDEVRIVSIVLEWFDHTNYERKFGY